MEKGGPVLLDGRHVQLGVKPGQRHLHNTVSAARRAGTYMQRKALSEIVRSNCNELIVS